MIQPSTVLFATESQRDNLVVGEQRGEEEGASASASVTSYPSCIEVRGQSGVWRYKDKPASWWRGQPANATSNVTAGGWDWLDDERHIRRARRRCRPLGPVDDTLHVTCRELRRLGVTRVFFVGDSTTHMMVTALWRLLRLGGTVPPQFRPFRASVTCPTTTVDEDDAGEGAASSGPPFEFEVHFVRNDRLNRNLDPEKNKLPNGPSCGYRTYCWPWIDSYKNHGTVGGGRAGGRTLVIVNAGVHFHHRDVYVRAMDDFFDVTVPTVFDPNDVVWFRTSVPGHANCEDLTVPFADYGEYEPTRTELYDWNLVEGFNDHVRSRVANIVRGSTENDGSNNNDDADDAQVPTEAPSFPVVDLLDVFNMTVLRGDGHLDCLHYDVNVPGGPVDWWAHLMVNNLMDLRLPPIAVPAPTEVGG